MHICIQIVLIKIDQTHHDVSESKVEIQQDFDRGSHDDHDLISLLRLSPTGEEGVEQDVRLHKLQSIVRMSFTIWPTLSHTSNC